MHRLAIRSTNVLVAVLRGKNIAAAPRRWLRTPAGPAALDEQPQSPSQQQGKGKGHGTAMEEKPAKVDPPDFKALSKYWEQYIEEYYEEEEEVDEEAEAAEEEKARQTAAAAAKERLLAPIESLSAQQLVELLREQRTKDIVCLDIPSPGPYRTIIICSPHNARHAEAVAENIRKFIKHNFYYTGHHFPMKSDGTKGWWTIDIQDIVIHMMTERARDHYDLEKLYTIGWSPEDELDEEEYRPSQ